MVVGDRIKSIHALQIFHKILIVVCEKKLRKCHRVDLHEIDLSNSLFIINRSIKTLLHTIIEVLVGSITLLLCTELVNKSTHFTKLIQLYKILL